MASHAPVLNGGFVWLDHGDLQQGAAVRPPSEWLQLLTHGFARTGFYRPLMALSLSLDALWGGPFIFHLMNLGWHAAATVTVFLAGRALGLCRSAAGVGALLFAVHPVTDLVVGGIAYRADSIVTVTLLVLVIAHLRARPVVAAVALLAGALTKETALVLGPLFILAAEFALDCPAPRANELRRRLWAWEAAALACAVALRVAFAPAWRAVRPPLVGSEEVGTRLAALWKSGIRLVLPWDVSICDTFSIFTPADPRALEGAVLAAVLIGLALWKRGPALFFVLALLPSLSFVPTPRFWSPHYLYLPLAFAAMGVGQALARLGKPAWGVAGVVAFILGTRSFADSARFRSDETLFTPEIQAEPRCREAQFYLGAAHLKAGRWEAAAQSYGAAAAQTPGYMSYADVPAAFQNLGVARFKQGRYAEAGEALLQALSLPVPAAQRRELVINLGASELAQQHAVRAEELLREEAARPDALPEALLLYARTLNALGQTEQARAALQRLQGSTAPPAP